MKYIKVDATINTTYKQVKPILVGGE